DPGDDHLQAPAGAGGRNIDVAAFGLAGGTENAPLVVDEPAAGQLLELGEGVDDADRDVGDRLFDGGRRFAAVRLPIMPVRLPLDEDRLGRRAPAIGGDDDADLVGMKLCHLPWIRIKAAKARWSTRERLNPNRLMILPAPCDRLLTHMARAAHARPT